MVFEADFGGRYRVLAFLRTVLIIEHLDVFSRRLDLQAWSNDLVVSK